MNIILDSNVIIAAFAARGLCHSVFELCLDRYTIVISEHILKEISTHLHSKLKLPKSKVNSIMEFLEEFCQLTEYEDLKRPVCRDRDDDQILALAKSSRADYIITGDKDLLILNKYESTSIVSPRDFWKILREENS